jgi:hypothetical protein
MHKDFRTRDVLELHDPELAAVLLEATTLRYLEPFMGQSRSADEVAKEMNISLNTLLYQIKRLTQLGFLELSSQTPRRGRAIKRYCAVAKAFFIPFDATHFDTFSDLLLHEYKPLYLRFIEGFLNAAIQMVNQNAGQDFGMNVSKEDGRLTVRHGTHPLRSVHVNPLHPQAPAIILLWEDQLRLDFESAKTMQAELFELFEKYRTQDGSGSYIAHIALAPIRNMINQANENLSYSEFQND